VTRVRTLYDVLALRASSHPLVTPLVVDSGDELSHRRWHAEATRVVAGLVEAGVGAGDDVVLDFECAEWDRYAIAYVAVQRIGACVLTMRPEIAGLIVSAPAKRQRFVLHGDNPRLDVPRALPFRRLVSREPDAVSQIDEPGAETPAELIFSSGATGVPKAITRSFGELMNLDFLSYARSENPRWQVHFMPLGTNASQEHIYRLLADGTTQSIQLPDFSPATFCRSVQRHKATDISLVPFAAEAILRSRPDLEEELQSVRRISLHSDYASAELQAELASRLPQAKIYKRYGLSEAGRASVMGEYEPDRPLRIGTPDPGTELRISDDAGADICGGDEGFVCIRQVGTGADSPWVKTRDRGRLLPDGSLELLGRDVDFLHIGSNRLNVRHIEAEIGALGGIADVAVIGLGSDGLQGGIGVLVVPTDDSGKGADACRAWLRRQYDLPDERMTISVVPAIPRTTTGKVLQAAAREVLKADPTRSDGDAGELSLTILTIVREVLVDPSVGLHEDLTDRGLDSMRALEIASRIADAYLTLENVDVVSVLSYRSVHDLSAYLRSQLPS
jgi:acyl-coenzyme A synthetase/AMP-(fatty) acid ligase